MIARDGDRVVYIAVFKGDGREERERNFRGESAVNVCVRGRYRETATNLGEMRRRVYRRGAPLRSAK